MGATMVPIIVFLRQHQPRECFLRVRTLNCDDEAEKFFSFSAEWELDGLLWPFLGFLKDKPQPYAKTIGNRMDPVAEPAQDYKRTARTLPAYLVATSSIPFLAHRISAPGRWIKEDIQSSTRYPVDR